MDVKLPESVEEFQKALREAFIDGAKWMKCHFLDQRPFTGWACHREWTDEARVRYPIKRKVPRTPPFNGVSITSDGDRIEFAWPIRTLSANAAQQLVDYINKPYDEVDE